MKHNKKTNAVRILDGLGIKYRIAEYEVDENHLDAVTVAAKTGMPSGQVFKTLVARGDRTGVIMAVISGDAELDLKALARASGNKSVAMVHLKEVLPLTWYIRGGCSPLGAKKDYPVYLDESSGKFEEIAVSAGQRGMQLILSPEDLKRAANAAVAPISRA
ncbi:MAG: Cys-tRNA(Pro) deacylase [Phascolarctobacterium sp.]|nr:Cys-tRNA(Pro) deacylase [Phascolarctobacterium sp.]